MSNRAESSNRSGRFNFFKNLKTYRDEQSSFDDPSFGDSGYTSLRQSTFNSTEHGSIRQSTSNMKTIDEEQLEPVTTPTSKPGPGTSGLRKSTAIVTPTTQSIQKMLKLRLETPKGQNPMDLSPVVKEELEDIFDPKTPPESSLSLREKSTGNLTPKKSKLYGRKRSFRDNIDENEYEEKRFCPNQLIEDKEEKLAKRIPISPIIKHNRRILRERSVSDNNLVLRSSTPKALELRQFTNPLNTGAIPKQQMGSPSKTPKKAKQTLRRYQSFSPGKLAHKQKTDLLGKRILLSSACPSTSHDIKETLTNIPEEAEEKVPAICRQDALDISDFDIRHCPARKSDSIEIEDLSGFNESAFSISRGKSISPIKKCPNLEKLFQAPIIEEETKQDRSIDFSSLSKSYCDAYSFHLDSVHAERPSTSRIIEVSPSKYELRNLLYRDLPKTPMKDDRSLKRTKSKTPVKKSLFIKRIQYYDGMEKLDFITRLQREGVGQLIEEFFKHLSDDDVINAMLVSTKWKNAIEDCKLLNNRRMNYITSKKMPNKENVIFKKHDNTQIEIENPYRKAFTEHNYDTRGMMRKKQLIQNSPPASPNTTKFKENQKIIRRLSPRAMTTCPRCAKPSPIITQKRSDCIVKIGRSTRSSAKKSAELRKTVSDSSTSQYRSTFVHSPVFSFNDSTCSSSSSGSERKIRRSLFPSNRSTTQPYDISKRNSVNSSLNSSTSARSSFGTSKSCLDISETSSSESIEEYAMCTGKSCGFKFCVRCQCEYKSNHVCRLSMELMSPGRDEDVSRNVSNRIGSRQSKRTLKRL